MATLHDEVSRTIVQIGDVYRNNALLGREAQARAVVELVEKFLAKRNNDIAVLVGYLVAQIEKAHQLGPSFAADDFKEHLDYLGGIAITLATLASNDSFTASTEAAVQGIVGKESDEPATQGATAAS